MWSGYDTRHPQSAVTSVYKSCFDWHLMLTYHRHSFIKPQVFTVILFWNKLIPRTVNNPSCCGDHLWKPPTHLQMSGKKTSSPLHHTVMAIFRFAEQMCFNPPANSRINFVQNKKKSPVSHSDTKAFSLLLGFMYKTGVSLKDFSPQNRRGIRH